MPRPRRRALSLAFAGALLFVVGTSVQAGWILGLSSLLFGTVLIGMLLPPIVVGGIAVERRAPPEAFQGDEVEVELVVTNRRRAVKVGVEIADRHLSETRVAVPVLGSRARVALGTSRRAARRGHRRARTATVSSSWPFGVAVARRHVPAPSETIVYPRVERLGEIPLLAWTRTHEHSVRTAPRRGAGPEYLAIREYRTGDSMRHVHWPSTARHGQVMVREFEQEHTRRLAVVVDTSADEGARDTPLDRCCSIAASVAMAASARGRGVRLLAARDGAIDVLVRAEPASMLGWLAGLRPFGGLELAALAGRLGPELRGVETLLLAVPSWRAHLGAVPAIASLLEVVPHVAVALVPAHGYPPPPAGSLAMSAEETEAFAADLVAAGAEVYPVVRGRELRRCLDGPMVPA
jgi:uncharacterized protein (DUF58 family)